MFFETTGPGCSGDDTIRHHTPARIKAFQPRHFFRLFGHETESADKCFADDGVESAGEAESVSGVAPAGGLHEEEFLEIAHHLLASFEVRSFANSAKCYV